MVEGRKGRWWAGVLAVALIAGCTADDPPEVSTTSTTAEPEDIVEGGTVRLGLPGPLVVDPAAANPASPNELMVLDLLYDGLTRMGADGAPTAALATTWRHDGNNTAWVFELDPEATFASGKPITNADVVASIERVVRGGRASLVALRLERIAGFDEFVAGAAPNLAGLVAAADGTVQITLTTPVAVLPDILAAPELSVVDSASLAAATADGGDLADLDLSGAWSIDRADARGLDLARRDDERAHLDAIELRTYDDVASAYTAFEGGDVDWALIPPEEYEDAVDAYGDDHVAPFHAELFFGLRVASPDLSRPELRTAIAQAIDREAIVGEVYADRADALTTVVPAGVPGHDPDRCDAAACQYDPDAAEATVQATFPDGNVPNVAIDFDESPRQRDLAEMVAADLRAVGIPTELRPKPLADYKAFVTTGAQELFSIGWIGGYASADAYLAPLFGSIVDDNLTGFAAADVDTALAEARNTDDAAAAAERWGNVERRVLSDAVVIPIAQFRTQAVASERVRDLEHAVDGTVDWAAVWVADG